jgi:hypothetical protein
MPISRDDQLQPETKLLIDDYDNAITLKIGDNRTDDEVLTEFPDLPPILTDIFIDDEEPLPLESDVIEADDWTPESYDQYLSAEVVLARGDQQERAVVKKRHTDSSGNPIGLRNSNPILDTREYQVEFPDVRLMFLLLMQ